MKTVNVKVKP